jgi:hypothetical protein
MTDVDAEQTGDETNDERSQHEAGGGNGSSGNGRKTAVRVAALAAAGGATALAAKKAFSGSEGSGSAGSGSARENHAGEEESLFAAMLKSGWEAARGTLLPVAEDAASGAGEYVARNAPDIVRERLVPRFISGFQRAESSAHTDEDESDGEA